MKAFLEAYDRVNFGDDLFVRFLVNRYPKVKFYMKTSKYNREVFRELKNLHIIEPDNWRVRLLKKIRPSFEARYWESVKNKCDCCIYIGGSIFIEYPNWNDIVASWDYNVKHHKYFVLGANFGPYDSEGYAERMRKVFAQMEDVCFRDEYSYNLFKDCKSVRLAPDILFSQPFPEPSENKKQVYISLIDCRSRNGLFQNVADKYEKFICDLITDYVLNGYRIKLISFCKAEGDERVCELIYNCLEKHREEIDLLFYNGTNTDEILQELVNSEFVVGTRFHTTVLALAAGKKVLPIIYSNKTKNMLKDIGYTGASIKLDTDFSPVSLSVLTEQAQALDTTLLKKESLKHFEALDFYLNKHL